MGYYLKKDKATEILKKYKSNYIADEIGISPTYISLMLSGKRSCPKRIAYCFTKVININAEIEDYFDIEK